jgi:hypothetical protein
MTVKEYSPAVLAHWPFTVLAPHQPMSVLKKASYDFPMV